MLIAFALAAAGVEVSSAPQLGVVTTYGECIAREMGGAGMAGERKAKLDAALRTCRDNSERSYASGLIKLNGEPFSKSWWKGARKLFDAMDVEALSVILSAPEDAKGFKVVWALSDGRIAEVGDLNAHGPVRVRIVIA